MTAINTVAKTEIHELLRKLAAQGMAIVIISDDLSELITNCNKIMVMKNGKASGITDNNIDNIKL